jgi:hypothetical protein
MCRFQVAEAKFFARVRGSHLALCCMRCSGGSERVENAFLRERFIVVADTLETTYKIYNQAGAPPPPLEPIL